ncbi:MAG: hypothetical protein AB7O66_13315 [Limisphaerales bacterium]
MKPPSIRARKRRGPTSGPLPIASSQPSLGRRGRADQAFTRLEALAIGIGIGLLALLALPTWGGFRTVGDQQGCLANFHQLTRAWLIYSDDYSGTLPGNLDGGEAISIANTNRTWAVGWLDFTASPSNTNTTLLRNSQLGPYVDSLSIYRCPADGSRHRSGTGELRSRSVSMNGYLGARQFPWTPGYRIYTNLNSIVEPSPSECLVFVDEREESLNDACFLISMEGYDPVQATRTVLVDFPAMRHEGGASMSFADGHAEVWRWADARTRSGLRPGLILPLNVNQPNNPDVRRLQHSASRRSVSIP